MKKTLFSALLLGAAVFAASPSEARPYDHPHAGFHHGPIRAHGAIRPHARFAFHHDFRHFSAAERGRWMGGRWHHRWWHGHYGWWWGVGGAFYFYPSPVYPYPSEVSSTYYDDDGDYDDSGDQGGGGYDNAGPDDQGGGGTWYHCSNPDGYYPYIKNCRSGWESVPAQPDGMQGGPQGGPGPNDNGPPPGGQYDNDQAPPPPPGGR